MVAWTLEELENRETSVRSQAEKAWKTSTQGAGNFPGSQDHGIKDDRSDCTEEVAISHSGTLC